MNPIHHLTAAASSRSRALFAIALLAAVALALLLMPDAALAVRDVGGGGGNGTGSVNAEAAGRNLAGLLKGVAQPVMYVIVAICGIAAVIRHQYLLIIGMVVGCVMLTVLLVEDGTGAIVAMAREFAKALGG